MAWVVTFKQDTEAKGVGTLTANFDNGAGIFCTHSERCDTNGDFGAFIEKCNTILDKVTLERSDMISVAAKIEAALNGGK